MNVIFYSSIIDEKAKAMYRVLDRSPLSIGLEIHRSIESLASRIRQPLNGIGLVLLNVSTREDLSNLIAMKERLYNLCVLLIMYETDGDAMKKAHLLRPRFVFGSDDDPEEVGMIYERMLARIRGDGMAVDPGIGDSRA